MKAFHIKKNTAVIYNLILEIISKIKFMVLWGYEAPGKVPFFLPPMSKPCQTSTMGRSPRAVLGGPSYAPVTP